MQISPFTKRWLNTNTLLTSSATFTNLALSIAIWQQTKSFVPLYTYHLVLFITIPIVALLSSKLIKLLGPKAMLIISAMAWISLGLLGALYADFFLEKIYIFGALSAVANTTLYMTAELSVMKLMEIVIGVITVAAARLMFA